VRGYLSTADDTFLIFGETASSRSSVAEVAVATGTIVWQRDDIFTQRPVFFDEPGGALAMSGHQQPVADTDTTVILYVSAEGPVKLNRSTGAVIWRVTALGNHDPPALRAGYEGMLLDEGVLYVPYDNRRLAAIDAATGEVRWSMELPNRVQSLSMTSRGLVVYGARPAGGGQYLGAIDVRTGAFQWPEWFNHSRSRYTIEDDALILMGRNHTLVSIDIASGAIRELGTFAFEQGDPDFVEVREAGLLLVSTHELTRIDENGAVAYQRKFSNPGGGLLGVLRTLRGLDRPEQATGLARDNVYVFTNDPDTAGRRGHSLVKVHKDTGTEVSRIWFEDKDPEYVGDPDADVVYVKRGNKELAALRFP
jgi:hypothetical protein